MNQNRSNTSNRFTPLAMLLHWLMAIMILCIFAVGVYMADLPFSPSRLKLYNWHKWAGIMVLTLAVIRIVWRIVKRPPPLPAAIQDKMPAWQRIAHHGTHHFLYLLFFVVPLLGWAYSNAEGFPIVLFGVIPLPDLLSTDKALAEMIKPLHGLAAFGLIGLSALHIAAALKHQLIDKDGLIERMLPSRK